MYVGWSSHTRRAALAQTAFRSRLTRFTTWPSETPWLRARRGYVPRYAEHLQSDTGARLRVTNLGLSGQTSTYLLHLYSAKRSARGP
jgi:transcriptional regulator with GAF, ATPase, and Fis domain